MSGDKAMQELEDNAQVPRCCPNCFVISHDEKRGHLDVAVPESCSDPDCLCHHPLRVAVKEDTKITATFGA
jgi:hypothetical protein